MTRTLMSLFVGACAGAVLVAPQVAQAGHEVCTWDQWGGSARHTGDTCVAAQPPTRELAHIVFDPFEFQEIAESRGDLTVHYQTPLSDADDNFFMLQKQGTYVSCDPPGTRQPDCGNGRNNVLNEIWAERAYHFRHDGSAEQRWTFASDWKPVQQGFEQMFQPALSGPFIYIPGAGGSVFQVLKVNGFRIQRIKPFATLDPNTYLTGGIVVDRLGFLYWNVVHTDPETGANTGYIVLATPWGTTKVVAYDTLIPNAPAADDLCTSDFFSSGFDFPLPPPDGVLPDQTPCGAQRPGKGVTPAIGADGTVFTASVADLSPNYSYMIALRPNLTLKWATSLRDVLPADGCGVEVQDPLAGLLGYDCSTAVAPGVDPNTNLPTAQQTSDPSSAAPVALPDGSVLFGATREYDSFRGVLLKLDRHGQLAAHFDFGWDTTPAVWQHDGTYSIITKDNHYIDNFPTIGPFYMTQLSKNLEIEWRFEDTTQESCIRQPDGSLVCTPVDPDTTGFEWCVNAPVVDRNGDVLGVNEDGNLFIIGQGGVLKHQVFLNQSLGAAYTPGAVDAKGRIYALNNGEMSIFGR